MSLLLIISKLALLKNAVLRTLDIFLRKERIMLVKPALVWKEINTGVCIIV